MQLDCREQENIEFLETEMMKTNIFKDKKPTIEMLEKATRIYKKKHNIYFRMIWFAESYGDYYMSVTIIDGTGRILTNISAQTMRELFLKTVIFEYHFIRRKENAKLS